MIADSVRLALPSEAAAIAAVQRRCWPQQLPPESAEQALSTVDEATMTASWAEAILRPPLAQMRVLVALADEQVVGFSAVGPSDDPDADPSSDGMITEFLIDPGLQRRGHGSRLLNACVDTLRADGYTRATCWVLSQDDPMRAFLTGAGWGADGAHAEIAADEHGPRLKMVRLHTAIAG